MFINNSKCFFNSEPGEPDTYLGERGPRHVLQVFLVHGPNFEQFVNSSHKNVYDLL